VYAMAVVEFTTHSNSVIILRPVIFV
jgi:hypothetical protein